MENEKVLCGMTEAIAKKGEIRKRGACGDSADTRRWDVSIPQTAGLGPSKYTDLKMSPSFPPETFCAYCARGTTRTCENAWALIRFPQQLCRLEWSGEKLKYQT